MQPLAQEIAEAQITGAENVEIAFCPCAALEFLCLSIQDRMISKEGDVTS